MEEGPKPIQTRRCRFGVSCKAFSKGKCDLSHEPPVLTRPGFVSNSKRKNLEDSFEVDDLSGQNWISWGITSYDPFMESSTSIEGLSHHNQTTEPRPWVNPIIVEMDDFLVEPPHFEPKHKQTLLRIFKYMYTKEFDLPTFHKLIEVVSKISHAPAESQKEYALIAHTSCLFHSRLMEKLVSLLKSKKLFQAISTTQKVQMMQIAVGIKTLLKFSCLIIDHVPDSSTRFDIFNYILIVDYLANNFAHNQYAFCINEREKAEKALLISLEEEAKRLFNSKKILDEKFKQEQLQKSLYTGSEDPDKVIDIFEKMKPSNHFRALSVYPVSEDFLSTNFFIRKNKLVEAYWSIEDYLDIHFKLLRTDFYLTLTIFGDKYLDSPSTRDEIGSLFKGYTTSFVNTNNFVGVNLVIQIKKNYGIESITSDFRSGCPLVLSPNNFDRHMFGLIRNVDIEKATETVPYGFFIVQLEIIPSPGSPAFKIKQFIEHSYEIFLINEKFEPYYHVLTCLQKIYHLPFGDLIVDSKIQENVPPKYLISVHADQQKGEKIQLNPEVKQFVEEWISNPKNVLDQFQSEAIAHAFNARVALIHGAPGTGKTTVAVHLLRILLQLKKMNKFSGPIILLFPSNHALDQFLCHILPYTREFI